MANIADILVSGILLLEIGLFLFFIVALAIKIRERAKERKNDKYKDVEK